MFAKELVKEFIDAEKVITKSALPNTFSQLHTEHLGKDMAQRLQKGAAVLVTECGVISGFLSSH